MSRVFRVTMALVLVCLTCLVMPSTTSAQAFSIGDTVEVTANLNVRTGAGTGYPEITDPDYPGYAPAGTIGEIIGGPTSANGYIWWRVDYGCGSYTGWSIQDGLVDVTQPPSPPGLISPPNGATGVSLTPTLQWSSVCGADYYGLYISEPPYGPSHLVFDSEVDHGPLYDTSLPLPNGKLSNGVTYYWNMRSHNSAGWGGFVASSYFTTTSPSPTIGRSPSSFSFSAVQGTNPSSQTLSIWNSGAAGSTINWTVSDNASWLTFSQTSGSSTGGTTGVTVYVNSASMASGFYNATITISAPGATNTPQTVPVTLLIIDEPTICRSPSSMSFSTAEGTNPSSQTLGIWNCGGGTLNWSLSDNASWLTFGQTSGSSTGEWDNVSVSVNSSGLGAGTYNGTITISALGATNTPQTVPVTLTVDEPTICRSSSSMSFSTTQGTNPSSQTLGIWNCGSGTLNWSLSDDATWLNPGPTSGTSTGEWDNVGVSVNSSVLGSGTYYATITVSGNAGNSPQHVTVTLDVISQSRTLTMQVSGCGTTSPAVGTYAFALGTVVSIDATPCSGWSFIGWTGDVASPGSPITTVTMDSDKTVTANFDPTPQPPAAPTSLSATAVSSSQIDLSWNDNASNENGFRIERKTGAGGAYNQITTVGPNVTTYSSTALSSSTTYYHRVRAYNAAGASAYSNEASATTHSTIACWSTAALSDAELANLVTQHFPDGVVPQTGESVRVTAYAVARAESGGNPSACGDNDQSIGIWQIHMPAHPEYSREWLFDPDNNAEAAMAISSGGLNWNPWCTWEASACTGNGNEAYRAYLDEARTALEQQHYSLTIGIVGQGSATKTPDQATYARGAAVQLTAIPEPGQSFTHWSGDVSTIADVDSPSTTVIMHGSYTIRANFCPEWRRDIQIGDILLHRQNEQIACLGFGFLFEMTHSGIYVGDGYTVEALEYGASRYPIEKWDYLNDTYHGPDTYVELRRVEGATVAQRTQAAQWAMGQADRVPKPDFASATEMLSKSSDPNSDSWYCSELVWASYKNQGVDLDPDWTVVDPVTPDELRKATRWVAEHKEARPEYECWDIFRIYVRSPVELVVTDPEGFTVSRESTEIPGAVYGSNDIDDDGHNEDWISIPDRKLGEYLIQVLPEPGASQTDTYSIEAVAEDSTVVLAENTPVADIPADGYMVLSTEGGVSGAIGHNTPVGTNVNVPLPNVVVTYSHVSAAGTTTVATIGDNPSGPLPPDVQIRGQFTEIATTAGYTGPVAVGIDYDAGTPNPQNLKLFHWDGSQWEDTTTWVGTVEGIVYGEVTTLSPFFVGEPVSAGQPDPGVGSLSPGGSARKLARSSDGVFHVVYHRSDGSFNQIYHSYSSDNGETWTEEALTNESYDQLRPAIAVDSSDNLHVVWEGRHSGSPGVSQVRCRTKTASGWQSIENLTSESYETERNTAIAIDSDDYIHIVWAGFAGPDTGYHHIRYRQHTTSWQPIEEIQEGIGYNEGNPSIAVDASNNLHVVWMSDGYHKQESWHLVYRPYTGSWGPCESLDRTTEVGSRASIAVESNGDVHIVGHRDPLAGVAHIERTSAGWQAPYYLESSSAMWSTVSLDGQDNLHVVWESGGDIKHKEYSTAWQPTETLISDTDSTYPNLMWASWPQADGNRPNVLTDGYAFIWNDGSEVRFYMSTWVPSDSGTSERLNGVWGTSSSDVFAVGWNGTILHYDGATWTPMSSGTTNWLQGIWGSSSSDVFAVGDSGTILHYDGNPSGIWTPMANSAPSWLHGVWGTSPSDVFAVGEFGAILHYDGMSWSPMSSGTSSGLTSVWGTTSSDVFVGSAYAPYMLHYNGSTWTVMPSTHTTTPWGVWGTSSSDVFTAGNDGTIHHYNGTSWSPMSSGTSEGLPFVWGSSATNVFAVGGSGTILHYNGSAWSPMDSGTSVTLRGVWGSSSSDVFVVGNGGTILHFSAPATSDTTPPAAAADLRVADASPTTVTLAWTAPGDDGSTGTASQYDLRISQSVITPANWDSATPLAPLPTPDPAGSYQTVQITQLSECATYYFALKTADEIPNWSGMSNVLEVVPPNTLGGSNVVYEVDDDVVTFSTIAGAGCTELTTSQGNPGGPLPPNFQVRGQFVDITTTATYSGPVTVCIAYDPSTPNPQNLKLFHQNGNSWEDVTTYVDTVNHRVCGEVSSLSWFFIGGQWVYVAENAPAFPSLYIGIAAAFGAAALAFLIRRRLILEG